MGHILSCLPCFPSRPRQPIEISHPFPLAPKNGTPVQTPPGGSVRSIGLGVRITRRPLMSTTPRGSPVGLELRHEQQHVRLASEEDPPRTRARTASTPSRVHAAQDQRGYAETDFSPYPQHDQADPSYHDPRIYNMPNGPSTFPSRHDLYNTRSRSPLSTSTFSIQPPLSPIPPVSPLGSSLEVWRTYARGLSIMDTLDQMTEVSNVSSGSRSAPSVPSRRRSLGTVHDPETTTSSSQLDTTADHTLPARANSLVAPDAPPDFHPVQYPSPITSFRSNSTRSYRAKNKLRKVLRVEGGWEVVRGDEAIGTEKNMGGSTVSPPRGLMSAGHIPP